MPMPDMLRCAGIDQRAAIETGEGVYVVAETHIKYRAPAKLDDDLVVLSEVRAVRAASCLIHQRVMRGHDILADATITAAFLSEGRPKRQPRAWVEALFAWGAVLVRRTGARAETLPDATWRDFPVGAADDATSLDWLAVCRGAR